MTTTEPASDTEPPPRGIRSRLRRYGVGAALVVVVLAAGAYGYAGRSVAVSAPVTTGAVAKECAALHAALPAKLLGGARRTTSPDSPNTAAWGDPAMVLRCGVATPAVLTPGSASYDPTTSAMDLNGVCWVSDQRARDYVFTTVKQQAYVELTVPTSYEGGESPLLGLSAAIAKTDPVAPDQVFDCS